MLHAGMICRELDSRLTMHDAMQRASDHRDEIVADLGGGADMGAVQMARQEGRAPDVLAEEERPVGVHDGLL
jgi:hypothetical protein